MIPVCQEKIQQDRIDRDKHRVENIGEYRKDFFHYLYFLPHSRHRNIKLLSIFCNCPSSNRIAFFF